jgi:hypothetical protein
MANETAPYFLFFAVILVGVGFVVHREDRPDDAFHYFASGALTAFLGLGVWLLG